MRLRARIDGNHTQIVRALRSVGATVQSLAAIGKGCPDLLVGFRGTNILLEVKDGSLSESRRKLTPDEHAWFSRWLGTVHVVTSVDEALRRIGAIR